GQVEIRTTRNKVMGAPYSSSFGGPPRAVEFGFMPNPTLEVPSGLHTLACDQRLVINVIHFSSMTEF
ncbi:MAG TPA: hypothetical protein VIW48_05640, partial [Nitrospiraceae bacterium]